MDKHRDKKIIKALVAAVIALHAQELLSLFDVTETSNLAIDALLVAATLGAWAVSSIGIGYALVTYFWKA